MSVRGATLLAAKVAATSAVPKVGKGVNVGVELRKLPSCLKERLHLLGPITNRQAQAQRA
jgi:hypothetical protein